MIQWKDDTWYEGDFVGNLRHGRGLYVDSRKQRSYAGGWHCGTKHGEGVIYYSSFNNSYDGEWVHVRMKYWYIPIILHNLTLVRNTNYYYYKLIICTYSCMRYLYNFIYVVPNEYFYYLPHLQNVRHGFGSREYCSISGYKGEWDKYIREGKGLMIWPNHDVSSTPPRRAVPGKHSKYILKCSFSFTEASGKTVSCPATEYTFGMLTTTTAFLYHQSTLTEVSGLKGNETDTVF